MKRGFMICLICFSLFFINASITVQAEGEGTPADAVACVIPEGAAEVKYFETLADALTHTKSSGKCTLKLLEDVSSATQIAITAGDFAFDLNGKRLSTEVANGECISVQDASVCFKDSSSEKTGSVKGSSSAISIWGGAKVTVESGTYEAGTWGIVTTDTPDKQVTLKINGGCFRGNVGVQTSMGTNYEISGGEFYGNQNSVNNNGTMKITDGTFYGEVYNAGGAVLDFQNGTVIVSEKSSHAYAGIENKGTLNLYGGNISAAEDAEKPMNGVRNGKDAILNLYGDVNFKKVVTDFQLEEAMNICGTLKNTYRVATSVPEDGEGVVFAKVKPGGSISEATFISSETGTIVSVSADGNSLSLSKCAHQKLDHGYACKDCGLQMYASIGDKYYLSLADAFEVVKNAESAEKKTVRVLTDISADEMANLNISGGTFTLDFNGHSIADTLNVDKGNVTIVGNGGTLNGLTIQENAYVEMSGLTMEGDSPVLNHGTFHMTDGKIDGGQIAIINMLGTVYLDGGEIFAEEIAVMNYGGTVTVGTESGTGPAIKASVGILNSKYQIRDIDKNADLIIRGGEITAETDIYNKSGEYKLGSSASGQESLPLAAGTVTLQGGTFVNGLRVVVDEGVGFEDILAEDYWYYDSNDKKFVVDDNGLSIDETVTVQKPTEAGNEDQDSNGSTDKETGAENTENQDPDDSIDKETGAENTENQDSDDSTGKETDTVKTGDPVNVGIWIIGLFISGAVLNKKRYKL